MAHRLPQQVAILCKLLNNQDIDIYIHVDKKVDINLFQDKINEPNISFIQNRTKTYWGGFSQVETILHSFTEILNHVKYDYICNISGQDLPLKNITNLIQFLQENKGKEFIENIPSNSTHSWWRENKRRVEKYSFINFIIPGKYRLEQLVNKLTPIRIRPHGFIFSGNSSWFCLTQDAVKYIISSYKTDKRLTNFFRYVWGADEIYFSTILYNSPFREKMVGNLVHTVWEKEGVHHPKVFTMNDINNLSLSNKFFARKFDVTVDQEIILHLQKTLS